MEYYSATKKNAFESVLMRWMKLELISDYQADEQAGVARLRWRVSGR